MSRRRGPRPALFHKKTSPLVGPGGWSVALSSAKPCPLVLPLPKARACPWSRPTAHKCEPGLCRSAGTKPQKRTLEVPAIQSLSGVRLFETPWTAAHLASLSFTISRNLLKLIH